MAASLDLLVDLLVALGIGALIGLQREQSAKAWVPAGARTMPLVALLGALTQTFTPVLVPWAFAAAAVLAGLGYVAKIRREDDPGLATSVAVLLSFVFGVLCATSAQARLLAVVLGVLTTVILALKGTLHGWAHRITADEGRAMLLYLVIALVVLPLLPDREVPELLGLNPRFVWLMVVFVSGIDLVAFLFVRLFARRSSTVLAGVVGGLVSSTATTVALSRKARTQPALEHLHRVGIAVASVVMLGRMAIEVSVVGARLLPLLAIPLVLMALWLVALVLVWLRRPVHPPQDGDGLRNPFHVAPALLFGAFFAAVLLLTGWLNERLGASGVLGAAAVGGLVDVDAVTLTVSRLADGGDLAARAAAAATLVVAATNSLFKVGITAAMGTRRLALDALLALGGAAAIALVGAGWLLLA